MEVGRAKRARDTPLAFGPFADKDDDERDRGSRNLALQLMATLQELRCQQVHSGYLETWLEEERVVSSRAEEQRDALQAEVDELRLSLAELQMREHRLPAQLKVSLQQQQVDCAELDQLRLELADSELRTSRIRHQLAAKEARCTELEAQFSAQRTASHGAARDLLRVVASLADEHCESDGESSYVTWRKLVDDATVDTLDARLWDGAQQVLTTLVPGLIKLYQHTAQSVDALRAERKALRAHVRSLEKDMTNAEKIIYDQQIVQDPKMKKLLEKLETFNQAKALVEENKQIREHAQRLEQSLEKLLACEKDTDRLVAAHEELNRNLMVRLNFRTALDNFNVDEVFVYKKLQAVTLENEELKRNVNRLEQSLSNLRPALFRLRDQKGQLEDQALELQKKIPHPRTLMWVRDLPTMAKEEIAALRERHGLSQATHCDMCVASVGELKQMELEMSTLDATVRAEQRKLATLADAEKEKYQALARNAEEDNKQLKLRTQREASNLHRRMAAIAAEKTTLEERLATQTTEYAKNSADQQLAHERKLTAKNERIEQLSREAVPALVSGPALDLLSRVLDPAQPGVEEFLTALGDCAHMHRLDGDSTALTAVYRRMVDALSKIVPRTTPPTAPSCQHAALIPDATDMLIIERFHALIHPHLHLFEQDVRDVDPRVRETVRNMVQAWKRAYAMLHRLSRLPTTQPSSSSSSSPQ